LKKIFLLPLFLFLFACSTRGVNENTLVSIKTTMGDIKIKLYDGTPIHRDNFIKLIKSGFYEGVSFHRVIKDFMIQAGDPATKTKTAVPIADSLNNYTIPAEIKSSYFHKRGALAAARQANEVNPDMRSSGTQFYIVEGTKYSDEELKIAEQRISNSIKQAVYIKFLKETADSLHKAGVTSTGSQIQEIASMKMFTFLSTAKDFVMPEDQKNIYKTIGGTPRLDGTYTVFGEVIEGLDVVERISLTATGANDVPLTDVKILKIKIVNK
jgi:cyclophilin family peptidyl-prolyl cis-trans isomerase